MASEEADGPSPFFDTGAVSSLVTELRSSFISGKTKNYEWRVAQLNSMLRMLENEERNIVNALREDLAKPELETCIYEIAMVKNSCTLSLKELHRWMAPMKVRTPVVAFPSSAKVVPEPLGVVLIISAWNYPILLSLDPVVGAIAAGNCVVVKPSEISPSASSCISRYLSLYLDMSAIKVVEGGVSETSALLEQKWDKIFYTGSSRVGRIVMSAAAKHLTPVVLELGGKCPVIVDSDIDLMVASRRIVCGKWGLNNGQACVSPDYVITTRDFCPTLIDSLKRVLEKFFGKNPLDSMDLARIVNLSHFRRLTRMLDDPKISGKIVHGGQRDEEKLKIAPTIMMDVPEDSLVMSEEIFGPLLPVLLVENIGESFGMIGKWPKPLAAYLFTRNGMLKEEFVGSVTAGGMLVNDIGMHLTVQSLPFGGVGDSGMGAYHGKASFNTFSHEKPVLYRHFCVDVPMRYPPYTPTKLRFLKALLSGDFVGLILTLLGFSWSH